MATSKLLPATNLILLPAPARARIVASNFRPGALRLWLFLRKFVRRFAHHIALLVLVRRAAAEGRGLLMRRLLRHVAQEILKRQHARRAAENIVANLCFDVDHQGV